MTALAAPPPKPPATEAPEMDSPTINAHPDKVNAESEKSSIFFPFSEALNGSMAKLSTEDTGSRESGRAEIFKTRST